MPPELSPDTQPAPSSAAATRANEPQQDTASAFKDGFDDDSTDNAPARPAAASSDKPAAAPEAPAQAPASAPAAPEPAVEDPFAGLPPAAREVLARMPRLEHELKSATGRMSAFQRQSEQLQRRLDEYQAARQFTAAVPAAAPGLTGVPPATTAYDYVREQLPEVADAITQEIDRAMGKRTVPTTAAAPAPAPAEQGSPVSPDDAAEAQLLAQGRPTWQEDMNSPDFMLWLQTQPAPYRDEVMSTTKAIVVDRALGQFDQYRGRLTAAAQQRQAATQQAAAEALATQQRRSHRAASAVQPQGANGGRLPPGADPSSTKSAFQAGFEEG